MAKIALELERALALRVEGSPGELVGRPLGQGDGWTVEDVVCTCGPQDRPFEEQHSSVSIAVVVAGSFQYRGNARSSATAELMTPGSLMLGNTGQYFECEHAHGAGDRCISFRYRPDYFAALAAEVGIRRPESCFGLLRVPPLRELSPVVVRSCAALVGSRSMSWEEIGIQLAVRVLQVTSGSAPSAHNTPREAMARVVGTIRAIERQPDAAWTLGGLARSSRLSSYHFLRTFERVTGVTPHQYVLRTRLRAAAMRLTGEPSKVLDIALDSGFGDVSNFNRMFRAEFGVAPRAFRMTARSR